MMLMAGDVAQQRHRDPIDPIRPTAIDDAALHQAMALGHLDIEPYDHRRAEAGTYELGFNAHDAALEHGATIEPGATATVESLEFLKLSPSIMARLWVASWTPRDGLRISAERLLPPRFRGRVCAYVTNIGKIPMTLPPGAPLIAVEIHFLSDARSRRDIGPRRPDGEPSARALESASRGSVADRGAGATVRIDDLNPMPFALRQPIFIAVQEGAGEFLARFAEADIEVTGGSPEQAIAHLKRLVVATYEDLVDADPDGLDHRQRRQRRVLADLLRDDAPAEV